jgi:hypothetical protein
MLVNAKDVGIGVPAAISWRGQGCSKAQEDLWCYSSLLAEGMPHRYCQHRYLFVAPENTRRGALA